MFRHAGTEVEFCFIVEDNICRLIINVKPELRLKNDLLPVASMSSPTIGNTLVSGSFVCSEVTTAITDNFLSAFKIPSFRCIRK